MKPPDVVSAGFFAEYQGDIYLPSITKISTFPDGAEIILDDGILDSFSLFLFYELVLEMRTVNPEGNFRLYSIRPFRIKPTTTFRELIADRKIWPEPSEQYEAFFCGDLVVSNEFVETKFPWSKTLLLEEGLKVRIHGNVKVSFNALQESYYVPLKDYIKKAHIIAEAMKHEYEARNLKRKTVDEILNDQELLENCSYAPYIINMIMHIYRLNRDNPNDPNKPFICILAPSCTGKTQLAFVLDYFSKHPFAESDANLYVKDQETQLHDQLDEQVLKAGAKKEQVIQDPPVTVVGKFYCVIHLICSSSENARQAIYSSFTYSKQFLDLLDKDYKNIKNSALNSGKDSYAELISGSTLLSNSGLEFEFESLGFLKYLIEQRIAGDPWAPANKTIVDHIPAISLQFFRTFIDKCEEPVIICLDEFTSKNESGFNYLFLCRNLLRESGCVVITMGTNSKATNLLNVEGLGGNSRGDAPYPWVYLISDLPKLPFGIVTECYPKALELLNSKPKLKNWLLRTSNNRLANDASDSLMVTSISGFLDMFFAELDKIKLQESEWSVLDKVISQVIFWIKIRKPSILLDDALLGQYLLHFACIINDGHDGAKQGRRTNLPSVLINSYFAFLTAFIGHFSRPLQLFRKVKDLIINVENGDDKQGNVNNATNEKNNQGIVNNQSNQIIVRRTLLEERIESNENENPIYDPKSYFSEFVLNELTYLVLLKVSIPAQYKSEYFKYKKNSLLKLEHNSVRKLIEKKYSDNKGRSQTSDNRDGPFLEDLGLASLVRASILGPFSGQSFGKFFLAVCKQLSLVPISKATFDSSILGSTADFIVPYLAPVNATFSSAFRSIEGVYPGVVISPRNSTKLDGIVLPCDLLTSSLAKTARRQLPREPNEPARKSETVLEDEDEDPLVASESNLSINEDGNKGSLVITAEMKNHEKPLSEGTIKTCCQKALDFKKAYFDGDPRIKKHVHLLFMSTKADWKRLKAEEPTELSAKKSKTENSQDEAQSVTNPSPTLPGNVDGTTAEAQNAANPPLTPTANVAPAPTGPLAAGTVPVGPPTEAPKVDLRNCRFFVANFDRASCRVYLQRFTPKPDAPKKSEEEPIPENSRKISKANSRGPKSNAPVTSKAGPMSKIVPQAGKAMNANSKAAGKTAQKTGKGKADRGKEKVADEPIDDKGKEKVADEPLDVNAEAPDTDKQAQEAQEQKEESTDHLLDIIVIPIEDMFVHPLV